MPKRPIIVGRLRQWAMAYPNHDLLSHDLHEAADLIERLDSEGAQYTERDGFGAAMSDVNARQPELDSLRRRLRIEWLRAEWGRTFAFDSEASRGRRAELELRLRSLGCQWPCADTPEPPESAEERSCKP